MKKIKKANNSFYALCICGFETNDRPSYKAHRKKCTKDLVKHE